MKFLENIGNALRNDGKDKFNLKDNQVKKVNTLLLLAAAGIVLIFLAGIFSKDAPSLDSAKQAPGEVISNETAPTSPIEAEERALSKHLQEVLGQMAGVGEVVATVNLSSSTEQEFAINTSANNKTTQEKDQGGGTRVITETNESGQLVLVKTAEGAQEQPVIIRQYKPQIQGVLVVAEGARDIETKIEIIRAVETLLNVPTHKVNVVPKESR